MSAICAGTCSILRVAIHIASSAFLVEDMHLRTGEMCIIYILPIGKMRHCICPNLRRIGEAICRATNRAHRNLLY